MEFICYLGGKISVMIKTILDKQKVLFVTRKQTTQQAIQEQ